MIRFTNLIDDNFNIRLLDVFILGPLQIIISFYIENLYLKIFMLLTGILNIIFNGHNYLLQDIKYLKKPIPILKFFINKYSGKTQLQKLYNVFIMYPLFVYICIYVKIPKILKFFLILDIICGVLYNFGSYLQNKQYYKLDIIKNKIKHHMYKFKNFLKK